MCGGLVVEEEEEKKEQSKMRIKRKKKPFEIMGHCSRQAIRTEFLNRKGSVSIL